MVTRSQKKSLLLLLLCVISFSAMAGGVEQAPLSSSGLYVEGNLGYSYRNWHNNAGFQAYLSTAQGGVVYGTMSNDINGFTFGGDFGYQIMSLFAVEAGWYYLPTFRYTVAAGNTVVANNSAKINSWLLYFGGKLMLPIYRHAFIFGKLAAAYMSNQGSFTSVLNTSINTLALPSSNNYWAPLFATGLQYDINKKLSVNVQYLFVNGYNNRILGGTYTSLPSPDTNLFTVGFGYKFVT